MARSTDEEFNDASEVMQRNLYYEYSTIDMIVNLIRECKKESALR